MCFSLHLLCSFAVARRSGTSVVCPTSIRFQWSQIVADLSLQGALLKLLMLQISIVVVVVIIIMVIITCSRPAMLYQDATAARYGRPTTVRKPRQD